MRFKEAFVVTHIAYRTSPPFDAIEGPYSSVCNALEKIGLKVHTLQIPLFNFLVPIRYGKWKQEKTIIVPPLLGFFTPLKYVIDGLITLLYTIKFLKRHSARKTLIVGVDPLSCFGLCLLKPLYRYSLVFYCVDYNGERFHNSFLKYVYEKIDEFCSKQADLVWAVCQALLDHKKKNYRVSAFYIPNSNTYNGTPYKKGVHMRTGNKVGWTGSCITERQFKIVFSTSKKIQDLRPDFHFYYAPVGNYAAFRKKAKAYGLKKYTVLELKSRREWQDFVATCDVGIAVYDEKFGSTRFIEPLKIWDFMMCAVPFIISCEPSIAEEVKKSGVAYVLEPKNVFPKDDSLAEFLDSKNLLSLQKKCLQLAKKYDISVQIEKSLASMRLR